MLFALLRMKQINLNRKNSYPLGYQLALPKDLHRLEQLVGKDTEACQEASIGEAPLQPSIPRRVCTIAFTQPLHS